MVFTIGVTVCSSIYFLAQAHPVDPTSDPTSGLVLYAVSAPGKQSTWAASGIKPTTGVVDRSAGSAIREDALFAAGACCCQSAAGAASTTTALAFFTFGQRLR